jgi:hypothetical protein
VMFAGALLPPLNGALLLEHGHIIWATPLIAVYVWSVLALAIGATMALLFLIQRGEAALAGGKVGRREPSRLGDLLLAVASVKERAAKLRRRKWSGGRREACRWDV